MFFESGLIVGYHFRPPPSQQRARGLVHTKSISIIIQSIVCSFNKQDNIGQYSSMSERSDIIDRWLHHVLGGETYSKTPLPGDASFRNYFRICHRKANLILMDAPPGRETIDTFLNTANYRGCGDGSRDDGRETIDTFLNTTNLLRQARVHTPAIYASSSKSGLVLMEDLGDALFLDILRNDPSQADYLYGLAIKELVKIRNADCSELPDFDADMLMDEMRLFVDWYCGYHLETKLSRKDMRILDTGFQYLVENALGQPQVYTHRDYHSRNLILTPKQTVGVIDHQDSVRGPLSYDLVSLLCDVYIEWPRIVTANRMRMFYQTWMSETNEDEVSAKQTETWFDLTALQRHIKIAGIFARLAYRDGKTKFLKDIPATMRCIARNTARYPEFSAMHDLLKRLPVPDKPTTNQPHKSTTNQP